MNTPDHPRWRIRCFTVPLAEDLSRGRKGPVCLRWLGQAGFVIDGRTVRVVIDPYLSNSLEFKYRGSETPHARMAPAPVSPEGLGAVDLVICTHFHSDHMDGETLRPLAERLPDARFVVPAASLAIAEARTGIGRDRLLGVDAGETHSLCGGSIQLHIMRAAHETLERDHEGHHRFLGYGIEIDGRRIFHSGDTIPFEGQRGEIEAFAPELALFPVNGRSERLHRLGISGNLTITEAVALASGCRIHAMVAHHFGMFAFNTVGRAEVEAAAARAPFQMIPADYQQAIEALA